MEVVGMMNSEMARFQIQDRVREADAYRVGRATRKVRESLGPERGRTILLSPAGRRLSRDLVHELAAEPWLLLICGRYEGVDERIVEGLPAEEVSIGDYVLSGGEVPALVLLEAVARLV